MADKRTLKALEELIKTEYMAVGALDAATEEVDDPKVRKQYRKFRDAHMRQAEALNDRLEDLGGQPIPYEVGTGKGQASLWGKITSLRDDFSISGMRVGAERGIKRYIDHIDEIDDPKTLNTIRKNLEAKQDEIRWYDDQVSKQRDERLEVQLVSSQERAKALAAEKQGGGGLPVALLLLIGVIAAAAFFLLRRSDESEFDDFGEDAFQYETDAGTGSSFTTSDTFTAGGTGSEYSAATSHGSDGGDGQG
jgi:Domain of unknown function (DUF2383)